MNTASVILLFAILIKVNIRKIIKITDIYFNISIPQSTEKSTLRFFAKNKKHSGKIPANSSILPGKPKNTQNFSVLRKSCISPAEEKSEKQEVLKDDSDYKYIGHGRKDI